MPFENVHGNGGLLTTVGDLLRWNENFVHRRVGGDDFVREQQRTGRFEDGREHDYALGLYVGRYKGVREVSHSGSTAGYRAFLTRFPDQHVSVAVLCNVSSGSAERYAHEVADVYLAGRLTAVPPPSPVKLAAGDLEARSGFYRSAKTGEPFVLSRQNDLLRVEGGPVLIPLSPSRFQMGSGDATLEFGASGGPPTTCRVVWPNGRSETYERVERAAPDRARLSEYAGTYASDEAEVTVSIVVEGDALWVRRRPDTSIRLEALYADAFAGPFGTVRFHRDLAGRVGRISVVMDRAWDVRFDRLDGRTSSHQ
jgi:hypothetical protein